MNELGKNIVFLNDEYLPLSEAKISVLDRGFLFGDGVYEVIPSYKGQLFRFQDHLDRLQNSLERIQLDFHWSLDKWTETLAPLLDKDKNQSIYLQITRGVAPQREHAFPKNPIPTVFAMSSDIKPVTELESGISALSIEDSRWEMCNVKATTLLANILSKQEAIKQGATEAILHKKGSVTEGAASNLFAIIKGVLVTPKKNTDILPGITRQVIIELAKKHNIPVAEQTISLEELATADEIWVTSSTREIVPVTQFDSKKIGNGLPGPIWKQMHQLFQDYKQSV